MNKLKFIIACMAALTVTTAFSGCSDESSSDAGTEVVYYDESSNSYVAPQDSEAAAKHNAVEQQGKINEQAVVADCDVKVNEVILLGERKPDERYVESSDMYAVELEVKNNNAEPLEVSGIGDFQISIDGRDDIIGIDPYVSAYASKNFDDYEILDCILEPGDSATGHITFCATTGWKEITISYIPLIEDSNYDSIVYTLTPDMVETN